jgi:hypothetical protein
MVSNRVKSGIAALVVAAGLLSLAASPMPQDDELQKCTDDCQKTHDECVKNCIHDYPENSYGLSSCTEGCDDDRRNCQADCKRSHEPSPGIWRTEVSPIRRESLILVLA